RPATRPFHVELLRMADNYDVKVNGVRWLPSGLKSVLGL
ncbi:hypothetical protein RRG08_059624, partial [Elysia crispata]